MGFNSAFKGLKVAKQYTYLSLGFEKFKILALSMVQILLYYCVVVK